MEYGDQEERIRKIKELDVDEYARVWAPRLLGNFETLEKLSDACDRSVVLRYEDMVDNWDRFIEGLTTCLPLKQATIEQIYQKTRPRKTEDKMAHHRSGKAGQFRTHLTPETVAFLNETFGRVIERFQYDG